MVWSIKSFVTHLFWWTFDFVKRLNNKHEKNRRSSSIVQTSLTLSYSFLTLRPYVSYNLEFNCKKKITFDYIGIIYNNLTKNILSILSLQKYTPELLLQLFTMPWHEFSSLCLAQSMIAWNSSCCANNNCFTKYISYNDTSCKHEVLPHNKNMDEV